MLKNYITLLSNALSSIKASSDGNFTDLLLAWKNTLLLILNTIGALIGLAVIAVLPIFVYKKISAYFAKRLQSFSDFDTTKQLAVSDKEIQTYYSIIKMKRIAKIVFFAVLLLIYIPMVIPIILFLL